MYPTHPGFVAGSETSQEAAESMHQSAATLREQVRLFISFAENGATCDEIEQAMGLSHQTCSARCSELKRQGRIVTSLDAETGKVVKRPTRSGRSAAVYFVL